MREFVRDKRAGEEKHWWRGRDCGKQVCRYGRKGREGEMREREREVLGKERLGSSGGKKEKGGSMGEEKREGNRVDKELGVFEGPRGGKGESEER